MSRTETWTILPVKSLAHVKQRLSGVLPLEARRRLVLTMLQDVLAVLQKTAMCHPVLVVTPDAEVADIAGYYGAEILREEEGRGHTSAAAAGFARAHAQGGARALTIPADVPLVTPAEIEAVIDVARAQPGPALTMVPSRDGDGTNALLVTPPHAFTPSFGPGSFRRHLGQAEARGLPCRVLRLTGLGMDTDEPADLALLMAAKAGDARYAFLGAYRVHLNEMMERA
jgi:2-phospho-L-lactate/phosphoenolpyruvate guanylyltransferase